MILKRIMIAAGGQRLSVVGWLQTIARPALHLSAIFARHLKGFDSYSRRCRFKLCSTLRCFLQKIWTWKNEESCSLLGSGKREEAHAKSVVRNEVWVGWRAGANVHHCNQQECRGTIRRNCNRKIMGSRTNNVNFCFKMMYSSHMAMLTGGMMIKHAIFGYLISDKPIEIF